MQYSNYAVALNLLSVVYSIMSCMPLDGVLSEFPGSYHRKGPIRPDSPQRCRYHGHSSLTVNHVLVAGTLVVASCCPRRRLVVVACLIGKAHLRVDGGTRPSGTRPAEQTATPEGIQDLPLGVFHLLTWSRNYVVDELFA